MSREKKPSVGAGRKLDSYRNYKILSDNNKRYWIERFKDRSGSKTSRNFKDSKEFKSFEKSQRRRNETFYKRKPDDYIKHVTKIEETPNRGIYQREEFEGIENYNAGILITTDIKDISRIAEDRGKQLVVSARIDGKEIFGKDKVSQIVSEKVKEWRKSFVKGQKGTGSLMEMNGHFETVETQKRIYLRYIIDVTFFKYT